MRYIGLALTVLLCGGCLGVDVIEGPRAGVETTRILENPEGVVETFTRKTWASGSGIPNTEAGTKADLPSVNVSVDTASVGEGALDVARKLTSMKSMYYIGGVLAVAGVAVGYFIAWNLGLLISGAGVGLIFLVRLADAYPWIGVIPLIALVGAGGLMVWKLYRGERARKVLSPIVGAIEFMKPANGESDAVTPITKRITDKIEARAGSDVYVVRDEVTRTLRNGGIK